MSSGDYSRPLSLTIPNGPYCPRRPTLQEVLSNVAPPPWTLAAFMAYLSQNHCLETLEFAMDAQRYAKHYQNIIEKTPNTPTSPHTPEYQYVRMLWQKLLDAYIAPNAPREVNLPFDVRDRLLSLPCVVNAPDPAELEPAVRIINELMDESVLVPFLNSIAPPRGPESYTSPWTSNESMPDTYMTGSLDERSLSPRRDDSPPISGHGNDSMQQSYNSNMSPRVSYSSHLTTALGRGMSLRLSPKLSASSGGSSNELPDVLTDDSTDSPSPSGTALEPMTPPNTPPTSHIAFVSPGTSPQTGRGDSGSSWKKMGAKFGWKRSRSGHGSGSSTSSSRHRETSGDESGGL